MNNLFAFQTMSQRVPGIVRTVQANNPDYPPGIHRALDRLHDMLVENQPIPMLDPDPVAQPDHAEWAAALQAQREKYQSLTWLGGEWFFAETFVYRHLIQAVRWHETGRDPFAVTKQSEFVSDHFWRLVEAALEGDGTLADRLAVLFSFALWGNRVDLSHPAGQLASETASDDELLVDDTGRVLEHLARGDDGSTIREGVIHLIIDNAGTELAIDLALADALLSAEGVRVVIHAKGHPTFVSDATVSDVWEMLRVLEAHGGAPAQLAGRLRRAWEDGRLVLTAPPFWNSSRFLCELPASLRSAFEGAALVVIKGDANYRRTVADGIWPDGVSLAEVLQFFPAPVVALRSLKCDTLVGVPPELTRPLDAADPMWRTTGRYATIQFAPLSTGPR